MLETLSSNTEAARGPSDSTGSSIDKEDAREAAAAILTMGSLRLEDPGKLEVAKVVLAMESRLLENTLKMDGCRSGCQLWQISSV